MTFLFFAFFEEKSTKDNNSNLSIFITISCTDLKKQSYDSTLVYRVRLLCGFQDLDNFSLLKAVRDKEIRYTLVPVHLHKME